jgi:hypothetical protein
MGRCSACSTVGAALRCSRCTFALYCNASCQKRDWKTHKGECIAPRGVTGPHLNDIQDLPLKKLINILRSPAVLSYNVVELSALYQLRMKPSLQRPIKGPFEASVTDPLTHLIGNNAVLAGSIRLLEYHLTSLDQALVRSTVNIVHLLLQLNEAFFEEFVNADGVPQITAALRIILSNPRYDATNSAEISASLTRASELSDHEVVSMTMRIATADAMVSAVATLAHAVAPKLSFGARACAQFVRSGGGPLLVQILASFVNEREWAPVEVLCMMIGRVYNHSVESKLAILDAGVIATLLDALHHSHYDKELTLPFVPQCLLTLVGPAPARDAMFCSAMRVLPELVRSFYAILSVASAPYSEAVREMACFTGAICSHARSLPWPEGSDCTSLVQLLRNSPHGGIRELLNGCRNIITASDSFTALCLISILSTFFQGATDLSVDHDLINAVALPTLLSALRKHGNGEDGIVIVSCDLLRQISCKCCPHVLAVSGTTAKLLRRLRDLWRPKNEVASRAAGKLLGLLE